MDERTIAATLVFAPATLLPIYFFKLPNCQASWGFCGSVVLAVAVILMLCKLRDSPALDQILLKRRKDRKIYSLKHRLLFDFPPALIGAVVGFHLGVHLSMIWEAFGKSWPISLPFAAYAGVCAGSLLVLVLVQFVRELQLLVFTEEFAILKPLSGKAALVRLVGLLAASEVAGVIGLVYVGGFVLMARLSLEAYDAYQEYADEPLVYWGLRAAGAGLVLICCCNAIAFMMMRKMQRRRQEEEVPTTLA
jgi:hypothetical protein